MFKYISISNKAHSSNETINMKKTSIGIVLFSVFLIIIFTIWIVDYNRQSEQKAFEDRRQALNQALKNTLDSIETQIHRLEEKAVPIRLHSVVGDDVNFEIKNNTTYQELKRV